MGLRQRSEPFGGIYRGRSVLITGHTGFKGAWLAEWLVLLGAKVTGYSLAVPTKPALFDQLSLRSRIETSYLGDILDLEKLRKVVRATQPDFVFHLAAQTLVRQSYREPVVTFATNTLGTVHVLETLRDLEKPCSAVMVTTDKCYENREWLHGYRETDPMGGHDPYSASKGAAELTIASYRSSFFHKHPVRIASGRAGNVIGGGDWATDRIVPDCMRALGKRKPIPVRNQYAVRPWQHVLEPLSGYLALAAKLANDEKLASGFNFGPTLDANRTVGELVQEILKHWPGRWEDQSDPNAVHEAGLLQLSIDKAHSLLHWAPVWNFSEAIKETVQWYRKANTKGFRTRSFTADQIRQYCQTAKRRHISWAC